MRNWRVTGEMRKDQTQWRKKNWDSGDDDEIGGKIMRFFWSKILRFGYEAGEKRSVFWGNARPRIMVVARCMAWEWRRKRERGSGRAGKAKKWRRCGSGFTGRGCFLARPACQWLLES